jgi:pimeloyl-ACP methyl ester carboxylesterase
MITLAVIAALLGAAAVVTWIGSSLIERAHPPLGRFIVVDGFRQHIVELAGSPGGAASTPPIVLLHGAGCNLQDMRLALEERLAGRRLVFVDRPGQGWSERPGRRGSSPAWQAAILRGVLDHLGIDRAILVGHSWGGTLALTFALDYPERAAGIVLLAPPTHPHLRHMTPLYRVLGSPGFGWLFAHTLALPLTAATLAAGLRAVFRPQPMPLDYIRRSAASLVLRPAAFLANAHDVADLKDFLTSQVARYATLGVPAILLTGDRDRIVPPQQHAMALAAAAPHLKLIVLPGKGHMSQQCAADQVAAAVDDLTAGSK